MLFLWVLIYPLILSAQPLPTQVQAIQQNHDLMGGVVCLLCGGDILETAPFGWADFDRNIPLTDSTVFRIASISKTITAIAFMQLYQQGLVQLDGTIDSILGYSVRNPNFPQTPITARMLLNHTSSLTDGSTYSGFLTATNNQNPMPGLDAMMTPGGQWYSNSLFLNKMPGSYFSYANINYGIVATLVEKITAVRFDQYCRQNILIPLGISGSFNVNDLPDINQVAVLYRKTGGNWVPQADNYLGIQPVFGNLAGYVPGTNGFRFSPQGGLRISGPDLGKIFLALMNHGSHQGVTILDDSTVRRMLALQWQYTGSNGNNYYGLFRSWGLGIHRITNYPDNDIVLTGSQQMFGHPGEAYGLVSDAYVDTVRKVGVIFMTNGCGNGYMTGSQSAFYTVEKDIFDAAESILGPVNCVLVTDQQEYSGKHVSIHPNPAPGSATISLPQGTEPFLIEIYNVTGRCEQKTRISDGTTLKFGSPGMKLIRCTGRDFTDAIIIIVQ